MYSIPLDRPADIVIASPGGTPKDINLYQAQKGIDNARFAVRPGGALILAAECREGLGEDVFAEWMEAAREPADLVARLRAGFVIGGHKAAALGTALQHAPITLVSAMPPERVRGLFFQPASSLAEALDLAFARLGRDASVLVMPNAGSTLPRVRAPAAA
jgi:nickel-dependent lactate racemase